MDEALDRVKSSVLGNRLAALSNGISEKVLREAVPVADITPVQLSILVLVEYLPGISIDDCRKALDFSHSYLVRMVEAMVKEGVIERRRREGDKRTVQLALTELGQSSLDHYHRKRTQLMGDLLKILSDEDQIVLSRIVEKMLAHFPEARLRGDQICRYCEMIVCHECGCPVDLLGGNLEPL